jgi:uncharacterized protein (TIGR00251 family)
MKAKRDSVMPTAPPWLMVDGPDFCLLVHVQPGARASRVVGEHGGRLKLAIAAPPVDGRANQQLIELLARRLGVRRALLSIGSGESARDKRVLLRRSEPALSVAAIVEKLQPE